MADTEMYGEMYGEACRIADAAHAGQFRKYTGEPYITHPVEVAAIILRHGGPVWLQTAALLHDVIEDTELNFNDLGGFPPEVLNAVDYMTERKWPGNRAFRKNIEVFRLAQGSPECQSLKLADIIANAPSIIEHDPSFAKVFVGEARELVDALTGAWPSISSEAAVVLGGWDG